MGVTPDTNIRSHMEGAIALAERKFDLAATRFSERSVDMDFDCLTVCELPLLAQAYDQGGKPDSAIAVYERYLTTKDQGTHLRGWSIPGTIAQAARRVV